MSLPPPPQFGLQPVLTPARYGPAQAWLPRPYSQLLRGPNHRWWRPLLSGVVAVGSLLAVVLCFWGGLAIVMALAGRADPLDDSHLDAWLITPSGLLMTNLVLAALIPVAQCSVWAGYGWRPRWVSSVAGGVRWTWLGRCYLAALALMALTGGVLVLVSGGMTWSPESRAGAYAAVILLTTPLQAAGEEYLFRGWLTQAIASPIANALVGAVTAALASGLVFAWMHGEQDPWLFADRLAFALVASWLVWRTGGLEASVALHGANNLAAFALAVIAGEVSSSMTATSADPVAVLADVVVLAIAAVVLDRMARRVGLQREFRPPLRAW
jgi:membrane protease YdiL (CAAX protease family)